MTGMEVVELPTMSAPFDKLADCGPVASLYTNFDHTFDDAVVELVAKGGHIGQHSAWNFCGYVWFADGVWCETVMYYGSPDATYACADLETLVRHVIDEHGAE